MNSSYFIDVAGVQFFSGGKVYYFSVESLEAYKPHDLVMVETEKSNDIGEVVFLESVNKNTLAGGVKPILRLATDAEIKKMHHFRSEEEAAFEVCLKKIDTHGLQMKLLQAHYSYDGSRLMFFFTADGRVDFRGLVKDLAAHFGTRIDLKQIGSRDETKMLGGVGVCGYQLCCNSYLQKPLSPTSKMARNQGFSQRDLQKLSGVCGSLKCCLSYEEDLYKELKKTLPRKKEVVIYNKKKYSVYGVKILTQTVRLEEIRTGNKRERTEIIEVPVSEIKREKANNA
jgi:cell fate regulator YaaT (PSP1 superfamily)